MFRKYSKYDVIYNKTRLACLQFVHTQACGNKRGKECRIVVLIYSRSCIDRCDSMDSSPILKQVGAK